MDNIQDEEDLYEDDDFIQEDVSETSLNYDQESHQKIQTLKEMRRDLRVTKTKSFKIRDEKKNAPNENSNVVNLKPLKKPVRPRI